MECPGVDRLGCTLRQRRTAHSGRMAADEGRDTVNDVDSRIIDAIVDNERSLLSAAFNCGGLLDAAARHNLCGESFTSEEHGTIFAVLCELDRRGLDPIASLPLIEKTLKYFRLWHKDIGSWIRFTEPFASGIDSWAGLVSLASRRRREYAACFLRADYILESMTLELAA